MPTSPLSELLKLPAGDRAELAMALWDSLTDAERDAELELTAGQRAELDRRCSSWSASRPRFRRRSTRVFSSAFAGAALAGEAFAAGLPNLIAVLGSIGLLRKLTREFFSTHQ